MDDEEEQLRVVLEATPIAIVVGDSRGTIVLANTHAQTVFGYTADEMIGRDSNVLVPERFQAAFAGLRAEYLAAPAGRPMDRGNELYGLRKDGSEVPIEIGLNPVRTRRGQYILAAIIDISERLLAEERTHSEEQMRLVLDGSADAMLVTDAGGRITLVNNRFEMMFGYLRPELLKNSIEMLIPERFREAHRAEHGNQLGRPGAGRREFWGLHKDGREVSIEVGLSPLNTTRGEYVLASVVDVTARKRAEEIRLADVAHAVEISALNAEKAVVEKSLAGSERRVRRQSGRLASLWRIVNTPSLHGAELVDAMLREAATAIRPGQVYAGMLGHIEGADFVLDAVAGQAGSNDAVATERILRFGERVDVNETLLARNVDGARTQAWDDCQALPDLPLRAREAGLRSQIVTHFFANGAAFVLCLASLEAPSEVPFGPPDYEYVEVLASFFARHLEQERLEGSLRAAEARARQHAERLAALWQVANNPLLRGQDLLFSMLRQGASALRSQQRFQGLLGRIEGDEVVVIGIGAESGTRGAIANVRIGRRTPLDETLVPSTTGTRAWDDISALSTAPPSLAFLGWRSAITTQFTAGASQYWLIFGSSEPTATSFDEEDHAYIDVLASSFANQLQVTTLEGSLTEEVERSRRHIERLDALQSIVNNPDLQHEELLQAMLGQAAAAIRPGQNFRGVLWFVEGSELTIKAVASSRPILDEFPPVGNSIPIAQTFIGSVIEGGRGTHSWNHIKTAERSRLARRYDTESLIVTTFRAGTTSWGLSFASSEATPDPIGSEDYAYMEVLASFFANHLQQRWQFERLEYHQAHDVLTGLLSRSQFRSQARAAAAHCRSFAIILVNIDAFREVNEARGHMIGDAVLVEVGNALRQRAIGDEIVGRIEGDVFGIYVPEPVSLSAVHSRALDYAGVFAAAFSTGDRAGTDLIARTGSLGIAVAPEDGTLIDAVLLRAGTALANAKTRGHGSVVFYEAGMEGDATRRTALLNEIAEALVKDQFVLYYQPHVEISTGKVTGCEALIRWNHPTRGLLLPSHFIPFAEANGAIANIDAWVMRNALAGANELAALRPGFRVFFNLSGRQAGNLKIIREFTTAARNGVTLANIGVEITESDAMRDVEATRHVCRALRRLNIRIAIDDFGTGYSSLSFLKRLPVDVVKIDRSFISGILTDPHDATIAETIIAITKNFGFDSLAEGVEDFAEADWLRERACRYMQGFAICRPLPLEGFKHWIDARNERETA